MGSVVLQKEGKIPLPGKEQPNARTHGGKHHGIHRWKSLVHYRGVLVDQVVLARERTECPGPNQAEHCQQDEGCDLSFLLSTGWDTSAMLYPELSCQHGDVRGSPAKGHEGD